MGAVFSMCPHLFLYPFFVSWQVICWHWDIKKEFGLSPDIPNPRLFLTNLLSTIHYFFSLQNYEFFHNKINFFKKIIT